MFEKMLSPAIALLNRMGYTKKFTLLWLVSLVAITVAVYSLFTSLNRVIQPSQRELQGLALIEPVSRTVQAIQQHRGISAALLGGNEAMQGRRADKERETAAAFSAMEEALPPDLVSSADFHNIKASWERLRKEGLHWAVDENFAAHTHLLDQIQLFELSVADEYLLILDPEIATFYLIDTTVNKMPHALEHLGQLRAYGTAILAKKQITESQKAKLNGLSAELGSTLRELRINIEKIGHYSPAVQKSLLVVSDGIAGSARQITGLVASDILTGHFATPPEVFLDLATTEINKGYAQIYEALLPTANTLIEERIAKAKKALLLTVNTALLLFLLVVYISISIYYAIVGSIRLLVNSAHTFAEGDLSVRVKLNTRDELSQIGDSLNRMADGFNAMLEERKRAEDLLQSVIENAPVHIFWKGRDLRYLGCNTNFAKGAGHSRPGDVAGKTDFEMVWKDQAELYRADDKAVMESGTPKLGYEEPFTAHDGSLAWARTSKVPLRDESNQIIGILGIYEDITERKRLERELRIAAVTFEAQEGITITDENGVIVRVNRTFTAITGYSAEEAIGNTPRVLKSGRHDNEFYHRMWESLFRNKFWQGEIWNKRKNGEIYPEWLTITAVIAENGKTSNYVAIFLDITERKQYEEQLKKTSSELTMANAQIEEERAQLANRVAERTAQLQYANRAKDSFLATMSHEIRTPLGGLLGMMELISLSRLDGKQREMLQAARDSGQSLLRIVNDILDWSKIEAGKLELAPQAATIPEIIKGVVSTYSPLADAKGLLLRQRFDSKLGAAHIFDPLRLSQILNNFTSNAIKFTKQGAVEISAELVARHGDAEQVRFCVKDSGIGIKPEQQAQLFQHYEQANADTARMYGGTGLGLAICHSLAELMGGAISVESALGRGSIFCITVSLPLANPAVQRDVQLRQAGEGSGDGAADITPLMKDGKPASVLVVDDHPVNRMLIKRQLEQLGLRTEEAAYGIVALSLWRTGRFDLVITDCHMPEMDGYELARSIREMERHDGRQRVPIIAWTANVLAEEKGRCRAAGMDDMLTKPTELADLKAMLLKWLADTGVSPGEAPLTREKGEEERVKSLSTEDAHPSPLSAKGAIPSHLAAAADTPIDFSVLKRIAASHAAQADLLQEFNLHNRSDIAGLKEALKDGSPAEVARAAHRIKGASRMVGAVELASICVAIERAAAQGDLSGAQAVAGISLDGAIARIEAAISTFTAGQ